MKMDEYTDFNPLQSISKIKSSKTGSVTANISTSINNRKSHLAGTLYRRGRSTGGGTIR